MRRHIQVKGGVLSTVVVVALLMMLMVLAVIALWEADFLLFSRSRYLRQQQAYIKSAFTFYSAHPQIIDSLDTQGTITLFDSVPHSKVRITRKPWGLYELVTINSDDGKVCRSGILGVQHPYGQECVLYYRNNDGAVTLTGKSHIKGEAFLPDKGIVYGQMQSVFFSGEELSPARIKKSDKEMPAPSQTAKGIIARLFDFRQAAGADLPYSLTTPFRENDTELIKTEEIYACYLSGNIILTGDKISIRSDAVLHDVLVVADEIRVEEGFRGTAQLFAADSVIVGPNVILEHPSGIYSRTYAEIGNHSQINGYLIVDKEGEEDLLKANCITSRLSKIRGLFYCSGIAQLQGIISGSVFLNKAVYYSPRGYYSDFLYDVTVLPNSETAYPLWLEAPPQRKEAKWVY